MNGPLSWLIIVPLLGAAAALAAGPFARVVGVAFATFTLGLAAFAWRAWGGPSAGFAFEERVAWLQGLGLEYHVGADGLGLALVLLTAALTLVALIGSWQEIRHRVPEFVAVILFLEGALIGVFTSLDLILFFLCWEAVLIPMFVLISVWGGAERGKAAMKFVLFTMGGSAFLLVGILVLAAAHVRQFGSLTFAYEALRGVTLSPQTQLWVCAGFLVAFLVKLPAFPVHTWLPDAHTEAPTAGSVLLAGVLLKMGGYGILRFCLPMFPDAVSLLRPWMVGLGLIGILYGALIVLVQDDLKRLVAYSSVSHMGYVLVGAFSGMAAGVTGAAFQMINHGITTGGLFLAVGMLYERTHTRRLADLGGLALLMPRYAWGLLVLSLSSLGLPGTGGFVGEFLVLVGAFQYRPVAGGLAALGVVLAAAYLLSMYRRAMHGPAGPAAVHVSDVTPREACLLLSLGAVILWIGIQPMPILRLAGSIAGVR